MSIKWIRLGTLAATDQAWLSAVNFVIAYSFMQWAEKSEYGFYLLILAPTFLLQGIQNALFTSPFATIFPTQPLTLRKPVLQFIIWGQLFFIVASAIISFTVLMIFGQIATKSIDYVMALSFAFAIIGMLVREATRAIQYAYGQAVGALVGDIIYGVVIICLIGVAVINKNLTVTWVLFATGLSGVAPLCTFMLSKKIFISPSLSKHETKKFWKLGRWALSGVVFTWINLSSYSYLAGMAFGVDSVAEINVARLFMMPLLLCLPAWSNIMRPKFSYWSSQGQSSLLKTQSIKSIVCGVSVLLVYITLIITLYPLFEKFLAHAYHGLLPLILAWAVLFLFSIVRTVFMANLLIDEAGYRKLSAISFYSTVLLIPVMGIAMRMAPIAIVGALVIIEIFQTALAGTLTWSYWKRCQNHV